MSVKTKVFKRILLVILVITSIGFLYYPLHESGHWLIAYFDGAEIISFHPFPNWENGLTNPYVLVNGWSFSSIYSLILYYLAGFLITFIPTFFIFIYLYKKESRWWIFPFTWVILSPMASMIDFFSIGRVTRIQYLSIILTFGIIVTSLFLTIWFIRNAKYPLRDLILPKENWIQKNID